VLTGRGGSGVGNASISTCIELIKKTLKGLEFSTYCGVQLFTSVHKVCWFYRFDSHMKIVFKLPRCMMDMHCKLRA